MQINKLSCSLAVLLIFLSGKGTVFQTDVSFKSIVPRLRPGLLSLRSVLSSRQICCLVALVPCCFVVTSCNIVNQLNNKTIFPTTVGTEGLLMLAEVEFDNISGHLLILFDCIDKQCRVRLFRDVFKVFNKLCTYSFLYPHV